MNEFNFEIAMHSATENALINAGKIELQDGVWFTSDDGAKRRVFIHDALPVGPVFAFTDDMDHPRLRLSPDAKVLFTVET